jgi:hypothetical protein
VSRHKYRKHVRAVKAVNKEEKSQFMGSDSKVEGRPTILGKKRSCAVFSGEVDGDVSHFVLTPKVEASESCLIAKKQSLDGKNKGSRGKPLLGPLWAKEDLRSMESVLQWNTGLAKKSEVELEESSGERGRLEGEIRRARMLHSDRQVMLLQSKHSLEKCTAEELAVRGDIERNSKTLMELQQSGSFDVAHADRVAELSMALELYKSRLQSVIAQKSMEEATMRVSRDTVANCDLSILGLENRLQECEVRHATISTRVSSLGSLLTSMQDQLQEMKEGRGIVFYPRPISSNPTSPVETSCMINACPVCSLWYSHRNFVFAACGHTYHHWCIAELSKKSKKCSVQTCNVTFFLDWCASIGIRSSTTIAQKVKEEGVEDNKISMPSIEGIS